MVIKGMETATPKNNGSNFYSPDLGVTVNAANQKAAEQEFKKLKNPKK